MPLLRKKGNQDAPSKKESCCIYFEAKYPSEFFDRMAFWHRFCSSCMALHICGKLQENSMPIHCAEPSCSETLIPHICEAISSKLTIEKWKLPLMDVENPISQRSCCLFEDCSAPLLKDVPQAGSSTAAAAVVIKKSECPHCARLICVQCDVPWHEGLDCTKIKKVSPHEEEKGDMALFKLAKEKD